MPAKGVASVCWLVSQEAGFFICPDIKQTGRIHDMINANVAIQVLPEVQGDEEIVRVVDEVIDYIKSTGVEYYVGPCETAMEGDYEQLMEIVKRCQYIAIEAGAPSVMSYVKITYKPDGEKLTIARKTNKHHVNDIVKDLKTA